MQSDSGAICSREWCNGHVAYGLTGYFAIFVTELN